MLCLGEPQTAGANEAQPERLHRFQLLSCEAKQTQCSGMLTVLAVMVVTPKVIVTTESTFHGRVYSLARKAFQTRATSAKLSFLLGESGLVYILKEGC